MFRKPAVLHVLIAFTALAIGLLVYLLDRQPDRVYFLSHGFSFVHGRHPLFGVLGGNLPTFVHVYAFILLTVAIAGSSNPRLWRISTLWFVIAALFECGQHPLLAPRIAAALPAWFAHVPILDNTAAYFLKGTFDLLDLLSIALGTVAAYLTAVLIRNRVGAGPSDKPVRGVFRYLALSGLTLFGTLAIIGSGGGGGSSTSMSTVDYSQLYISNNNGNTLLSYNNANSVSGSTAVNRVVAGGSTTLNQPRGIAVDMPRNQIYVANFSNNTILVFNNARTASGGNAPSRTISGGTLSGPSALFIDVVNDRLYVVNIGGSSVLVYDNASTLNGVTTPTRLLIGNTTTLSSPTGAYVDITRNLLYVANGSNQILVFNNAAIAPGTNNIAPLRTISVSSSTAGIFVDVMADRLYVADMGANSVFIFNSASTANSSSTPDRTLSGGSSMLVQPLDVFVDIGADRLYVSNAGANSILVFNNASTVNNPAPPDRTLTLSASTVPWGIYVDVTPIVIGSTATLDGFARSDNTASASGSPATGDKDASYFPHNVGWRQLYSFDIGVAGILPAITITSATLHLYQCDVVGTAPYTVLGNIIVDHVNYGGVFDPLGSAYNGATVASNIGTLSTTSSLGYRSLSVTGSVQNDLVTLRTTSQYRLKFSLLDFVSNGLDEFVQFTDAEDSPCLLPSTNQPPQLAVTLRP